MNLFDENSNLMDGTDWLEGFNSTNLDDQIFNDILPTDDSLNLQPDLYALDSISSSMQFQFGSIDNNSESSDSGNYSPTSSSSEQPLTAWAPLDQTYLQQPQSFGQQSAGPTSREVYQPVALPLEAAACGTPDYKPVLYAESYGEAALVANAPDTYNDVASLDSRQFVRPPTVVESSPQPPPPMYYADYRDDEYIQSEQPNIVYIVQKSESANGLLGQHQRCAVSPQRNIVLLPTPMKMTHTVPKCVNLSANRYAKRLLPPNTFVAHRPAPSAIFCHEEEDFMRKKEDRKLRNRAAAQMSRLRKRNEFDHLKTLLADKENECSALRSEVVDLRRKVAKLDAENKELRGLSGGCQPSGELDDQRQRQRTATVKKASGVFALAFVALMIFPGTIHTPSTVTEVEMSSNNNVAPYVGHYETRVPHVGHALIALKNPPRNLSNATGLSSSPKDLQLFRNASSSFVGCPDGNAFYNSSQNVRLNAELTHWIERHEQMNFVQLRRGNVPSVIFNGRLTTDAALNTQPSFLKYFSHPSTAKWVDAEDNGQSGSIEEDTKKNHTNRLSMRKKVNSSKSLINAANISDGSERSDASINSSSPSLRRERAQQKIERERMLRHFNMIKRSQSGDNSTALPTRNAVSAERQPPTGKSEMLEFTSKIQQKGDTLYVVAMKDYFLLPALDIAKSAPKVSLILPALSANLSVPGQLTMMRIECNVVATSIFYLPDSVISLFNSSSS